MMADLKTKGLALRMGHFGLRIGVRGPVLTWVRFSHSNAHQQLFALYLQRRTMGMTAPEHRLRIASRGQPLIDALGAEPTFLRSNAVFSVVTGVLDSRYPPLRKNSSIEPSQLLVSKNGKLWKPSSYLPSTTGLRGSWPGYQTYRNCIGDSIRSINQIDALRTLSLHKFSYSRRILSTQAVITV
jgi:hypothetical protein